MAGYYSADVANQALSEIGSTDFIGDLEEGTEAAKVLLRSYTQCLMQLQRAAHWDFLRKFGPLFLLADASGQTAGVSTNAVVPWIYEYEYPPDCLKARFLPWNNQTPGTGAPIGNIQIPNTSVTTGTGPPFTLGQRLIPAPFLVAMDYNFPTNPNAVDTPGVSPIGRTVVLTNVKQASLVYTCLNAYPTAWDSLFRAAFVAYLASHVAFALTKDKKLGLQIRDAQTKIATGVIASARATSANESGYPQTIDNNPDWMRIRQSGAYQWGFGAQNWGGAGTGLGCLGYGWDALPLAGGGVY